MKKVLFVAKVVRSHIVTFHLPYLKLFKEMGWETAVAAHNDYDDPKDCVIPNCDTYYDVPFERFPLNPSNVSSYWMLKKIIDNGEYDIIHCHTPVSAMITRIAALEARKLGTKVVYTAHGFHFFKGAPLINWLLYFPIEWLLARFTDVLITINKEDYIRSKKFSVKNVYYVPGVGIDTKKFNVSDDVASANRSKIRTELGIPADSTVLLSVGEVNDNKNHRIVIEALSKLNDSNVHYVICGRGELVESHLELAKRLGLEGRVHFTGYRNNVSDYYQASDIFVFPSLREGLSVAVMEAMASGLPIVCSAVRGNTELVVHGENGILISSNKAEDYAGALKELLDIEKRLMMGKQSAAMVSEFELENVRRQYKQIYCQIM